MKFPRIYQKSQLKIATEVPLERQAEIHLTKVLRLKTNAHFILFNGDGSEYKAKLIKNNNQYFAHIEEAIPNTTKLTLSIHIGQSIIKGERMDYALQKMTELGVTEITPLWTKRNSVKLNNQRLEKKVEHWQKVIISACEQCGRNSIPILNCPYQANDWFKSCDTPTKIILSPTTQETIENISSQKAISIAIGPEGGWDNTEESYAQSQSWLPVQLGNLILRSETAGPAVLAALQTKLNIW